MDEPSVEALLREYADRGSQAAFTEVVRRTIDLVYSTAVRRVGGDAHLASDVTQLVFLDLARQAAKFPAEAVLSGWLHQHTSFRAATMVRSERRRHAREVKAAEMEKTEQEQHASWPRLASVLEDALESFSRGDRDAIILRFFAGENLAGVGRALGITDDAAQKRVSRALEKLQSYFGRRGMATSAAALAAAITANGVHGAPAGLAATAASSALLHAAAAGGGGIAALATALVMGTKIKIAIATTAGTLALGLIVTGHRENVRLRAALAGERLARIAASSTTADPVDRKTRDPSEPDSRVHVPRAKVGAVDVEVIMARVIRDELWRDDRETFQALLNQIEHHDLPTALAYVSRNAGGETRRALHLMLVEHWAGRDINGTAAWCRQLAPSADHQQIKEMVSNIWARTDPEAALQLAPSAEGFRQLALRSPHRAEAEAVRLPPGNEHDMAIEVVTATKFEQDPQSAIAWLGALTGDDRATALSAIMPELIATDPFAVASYVEQLSSTDRARQLARDFAVQWANKDAPAAAAWSAKLSMSSPWRERAIAGVVEIWARSDPVPAAAWISDLSADRARETAARLYIENVAPYDPAAAAALVPRLADQERDTTIVRIAHAWLKSDGEAARRWLAQTPLPETQKQALLEAREP